MPRLFVAVHVPDAVRAEVDEALTPARAVAGDRLRWTRPEGWHLTLAFLGQVPDEAVAAYDAAVAAAAAAGEGPFEVVLPGSAGTFRSGVLWATVDGGPGLAGLAEAVRRELVGAGAALEERPFSAHLTLARTAGRGRARIEPAVVDAVVFPPQRWRAEEVALVSSTPGRGGSVYADVGGWRLGSGAAAADA